MKRLIILVMLLACTSADARTLTGAIETRIRSNLANTSDFGTAADNLDYLAQAQFQTGTDHGAISQIYRADRTIGTASADVIGLVGSLTNAIGETVTFATVKAVYVAEISGAATLTLSGLATATIPPWGSAAFVGARTVASVSDSLTISTDASATYRVWIVGE